ncbi:condensation domain-containing protein [Kitasatospora sp. NPDC001547]|uniref:condensation domain-containing protein n=1 Tax=Kitasatospora sp. NPDC001547 TaxID=3364015 RepID=UPI0036A769BC
MEDPYDLEGDGAWFELWNGQRGLWLQHQLDEGRADSNLPYCQHVYEAVDIVAVRRAAAFLVDRHQALRLSFRDTSEGPRQRVLPEFDLDVPLVDLTGAADPAVELDRCVRVENATPFDDLATPPVRLKVFKLAADHHCLYVNVHHILTDGTSMGIFLRELLLCYRAFAAGAEPELPPLPTTYDAFVRGRREWLASDQSKAMEAYWLDQLAAPLPRLRIGDYDAPADEVVNETLEFDVEADTAAGLAALARKLHVTPHILLLSAYAVALRDISADDDIVVCVPFSGRDTKELDGMFGSFVNPLSVRVRMSGADPFDEVVRRTRAASVGAYAHSRYPYTLLLEKLDVEARPGRNPVFSTSFQFADFLPPARQTSQLDLCLFGRPDGDRLRMRLNYNSRRLAKSEAEEVRTAFLAVLRTVVEDVTVSLAALAEPLARARRAARTVPAGRRRLGALRASRPGTPGA